MYLLVLIVSVALAIPTFGGSIAFFLLFRSWWDNGAVKLIMQQASQSLEAETEKQFYQVNQSAVLKLFKLYGTDDLDVTRAGPRLTLYTGTIRHPEHDGQIILSIFRTSITGELNVSAKPLDLGWINSIFANVQGEMKSRRARNLDDSSDIPI